jgi:hypothetical protein
MRRVTMVAALAAPAALAVASFGAGTAGAADPPTSIADTVECRFVHGLTQIPFRPDIHLSPTSTECTTTVYEYQGPEEQPSGEICSFFVLRPVIRWYHGNQLRDGRLRDGAREYASLNDDSLPMTVCAGNML